MKYMHFRLNNNFKTIDLYYVTNKGSVIDDVGRAHHKDKLYGPTIVIYPYRFINL